MEDGICRVALGKAHGKRMLREKRVIYYITILRGLLQLVAEKEA